MAKNIRKFNTYSEYEAAELEKPAVSLVVSEGKVYFDQIEPTPPTPTFDGKWLATYTGGTTSSAVCDASSAITYGEISEEGSDVVSVEIGNCVTSIGDDAFAGCENLTSINIPDNVTSIGMGAFYSCGITSIDIPDNVTSIGMGAFGNCTSLTSVTIGSGVTIIDEVTFSECSSLTSIDIPDSVTSIGEQAFECESLTSVTIGSGITLIETGAFGFGRNLTSVTIYATTPPTLEPFGLGFVFNGIIYVPDDVVNTYKAASDWEGHVNDIYPISEYS